MVWLRRAGSRQVAEAYAAIQSYQVAGQAAGARLLTTIRAQAEQEHKRLVAQRDRELSAAKKSTIPRTNRTLSGATRSCPTARHEAERVLRQATARRQEMLRAAEEKYPPLLEQIQTTHRTSWPKHSDSSTPRKADNDAQLRRDWDELISALANGNQPDSAPS